MSNSKNCRGSVFYVKVKPNYPTLEGTHRAEYHTLDELKSDPRLPEKVKEFARAMPPIKSWSIEVKMPYLEVSIFKEEAHEQ
jgi:hypothetical protein